jgi:hypothetical protein
MKVSVRYVKGEGWYWTISSKLKPRKGPYTTKARAMRGLHCALPHYRRRSPDLSEALLNDKDDNFFSAWEAYECLYDCTTMRVTPAPLIPA